MIRLATKQDLSRIIEITHACAAFMISKNIFQWNEHYPNIETFEKDVDNQTLYVIESDLVVIGCIVISDHMDDFYSKVKWITPNNKNIYLHRLAVHPNYQGKGYAKQLMNFSFDFELIRALFVAELSFTGKEKFGVLGSKGEDLHIMPECF